MLQIWTVNNCLHCSFNCSVSKTQSQKQQNILQLLHIFKMCVIIVLALQLKIYSDSHSGRSVAASPINYNNAALKSNPVQTKTSKNILLGPFISSIHNSWFSINKQHRTTWTILFMWRTCRGKGRIGPFWLT